MISPLAEYYMKHILKVPISILERSDLTSHEKVVWLHLLTMQEMGATIYSLAQASELFGLSARGFQRIGRSLVKKGLITKTEDEYIITGGEL